jgi:Condensation domain/Sulfotransferase domain
MTVVALDVRPEQTRADGHFAQVIQNADGHWWAREQTSANETVASSPVYVTSRRAEDWVKERELCFATVPWPEFGRFPDPIAAAPARGPRQSVHRRFRAFCVGLPKSGTSSVAEMFAEEFRVAHEPDGPKLATLIAARLNGRDRGELSDYLTHRDRRLALEMDSTPQLGLVTDLLVERFPEARFVLTVREPMAWLRSRVNHIIVSAHTRDAVWDEARFGTRGASSFPASRAIEAAGAFSVEGLLSAWVKQHELCLRSVPPARLLVIETQAIAESAHVLEDFLGIDCGSLDPQVGHSNATAEWSPAIECLADESVERMARRICGSLWDELRSLSLRNMGRVENALTSRRRLAAPARSSRKARGPLSWQVATNLRRNASLGIASTPVEATFTVPEELTNDRLRERLAEMARREDILRITELPEDGYGTIAYSDEIDLPFETRTVDSPEDLEAELTELREGSFPLRGGPLWRLVVVEHPDHAGRSTRTACAVFDHMITDGRSLHLFEEEVTRTGQGGVSTRRRGRYRDFVLWQLERFPLEDATEVDTPARTFWRRYLDGSAPTHATILPFCDPNAPLCGREYVMRRPVPISTEALQATARRLRTTPLLVLLAGVVSAIGSFTAVEDLTLRYMAHGRVPQFLQTLGWFSGNMPLRIRGANLGDPLGALRATMASRSEILDFEETPWGYIMEVCGATDSETPQVTVNFSPYPSDERWSSKPAEETIEGRRGFLNLAFASTTGGDTYVISRFDPDRFARDGVQSFVGVVLAHLRELAAA